MILKNIENAPKAQYEYIDRRAIKNIVDTLAKVKDLDDKFIKKLKQAGMDELEKAILRCVYHKAGYRDWKTRV
jgi:transcription termination factor NusB